MIKYLQKFLQPESDKGHPEELDDYAQRLIKEMDNRFASFFKDPLFIVAAFLDPQYKLKWCRREESKVSEVKATVLDLMKKVDSVTARPKENNFSGPPRKKRSSALEYSDDKEDTSADGPDGMCSETELQLYLESPKTADVLQFWENNKTVFPRLCAMTRTILCVPATTAGVGRLLSISGFVLSNRRLSLTDKNYHDHVFSKCNLGLFGLFCTQTQRWCVKRYSKQS